MYFTRRIKRGLPVTLSLAAVFLYLVCPASAEDIKGGDPGEQNQLVRVCTLNSVEANQEFQRNVQIVQAQRQHIISLQTQLTQARTDDLKKALQDELDQATKKLNDNNKKMVETYGFSLNRNYVLVTEKAHVYMIVNEDEATQIKQSTEGKKKN